LTIHGIIAANNAKGEKMRFDLTKCHETKRVILSECESGAIDGQPEYAMRNGQSVCIKSAWQSAREKVDTSKMLRIPGRGWFASADDAFPKQ
jgi:hypothetical protein